MSIARQLPPFWQGREKQSLTLSTSKVLKFTNLKDIYKSIDNEQEYCDGSFTYSVPLMFQDGSLNLNNDYND